MSATVILGILLFVRTHNCCTLSTVLNKRIHAVIYSRNGY